MDEKKTKKEKRSFAYYIGVVIAYTILISIATCAIASLAALVYKFISLVLGVVM